MSEPVLNAFDDAVLREALDLARCGTGYTRPNPVVGCVVVSAADDVIGRGFHQRAGEPHAEVVALDDARSAHGADAIRGGTAYVSLEPCNHHGRTPPCVNALIEAGVARVVFASRDPNPHAEGGAEALRAAGVDASGPHLEDEGRAINRPFYSAVERGRPWVVAKWAMSLDGRIATRTGQSQWITGEAARAYTHRLRGRLDAIMVGSGTVLADDPQLTYRGSDDYPQPVRIVLDGRGRTPPTSHVLGDNTIVVTRASTAMAAREAWTRAGATVWTVDSGGETQVPLQPTLERLTREREIQSILVEGGAQLLGSAFDGGLVDAVAVFIAPIIIGGDGARSPLAGLGVDAIGDALRLRAPAFTTFARDGNDTGADLLMEGEITTTA